MIRLPGGRREPNIHNRSSKNRFNLTRSGLRHLQERSKALGIPEYKPNKGYHRKDAEKKDATAQKAEEKPTAEAKQ